MDRGACCSWPPKVGRSRRCTKRTRAYVRLPSATLDQMRRPSPNCAVTTVKLGGLSATEFFGLSGGPSGFNQSFGVQASADRPPAQRCIRLELDNPAPGDLVPIGGYVIEGFAFDPNTPTGQ